VGEVICSSCGHRNPDDANFCSACGTALQGTEELTTSTLSPVPGVGEPGDDDISVAGLEVPRGVGMLVVKRGPNAGSKFLLEPELTRVGRHPESDIFLDDITVSRRHAELQREGGGYLLRDVGSLNGTYLNRERIDSARLTNGDEVQIGKFKLIYLVGGDEG
jgi:hypothetical protein